MILLDTNVVSELMRPKPDPGVAAWLAKQSAANVFISVITEAELRYGVAILPAGQRCDRIAAAVENMLQKDFARRILPACRSATQTVRWRPSPRCRGAAIATRNVGHFEHCGIEVINPWSA